MHVNYLTACKYYHLSIAYFSYVPCKLENKHVLQRFLHIRGSITHNPFFFLNGKELTALLTRSITIDYYKAWKSPFVL